MPNPRLRHRHWPSPSTSSALEENVKSALAQGFWGVLATFDELPRPGPRILRNLWHPSRTTAATAVSLSACSVKAASLQQAEADAVAQTVAASTQLPYVLGLSEREPDAVVAQAQRLLGVVPRFRPWRSWRRSAM